MAIDWAARRKAANKKTVEPKYDAKTSYSWKSQLRPIAELEQEIQQKNYERITSSEDFGVMPSASVPGSIAQKGINLRNQINVERPKIEYNAYQKNVEAGAKARNMTVPAYEKFIQMEIEKQNELEKPSKGATGLMGIIADKIIKENKRTTFTKPVDNLVMEQTKKLMDSGVMKGAQVISGGFATGATGVQEAFTGLAKAMYAPSNEVNKWATDYAKSKGILVPNFNPYSMLDDFAKRSSIMRDVAKKNIGYYDSNSTVQFMSDMVEQLPSQMLRALPGGRVLYTLYAIGSSVNQYIKGEQPWYKEWTMALGAAGIDAGTEALFPMFGKGKRSIMKLLGKMAEKSPKFIPTMLDYVKMAGLSFASEGAEEGLSYLGTTLLDWAVMKEMKGDTELNLGDASKQMLMGALSGLLLSGMPMVLAGSDINAKKELNDAISNALNKKPTEVTVADIERVVKTTADAAIETGYVPGTATSNVAQTAEEKRKSRVESVVNKYKNVVGTLPNSTTSTNVGTVATDVAPIQTAPIAQSEVAPVAPIAPTKETVVKPTAPVKKYVKADDGKYTQQPQQNIVQNVNMQESAPVVESKQQEGKQVKKFVGEDEFSIVRRKYESDKHITTPPATITEPVATENVTDNKFLANAEIISTKTSTGNIYRLNGKVYKHSKLGGKGRQTQEADVYKALDGVDEIASGHMETIDGVDYVVTPEFRAVISIDDIPSAKRDNYRHIVADNMVRINKAVEALSNAGYSYNDPLQFGYADGKLYLMDFSNASEFTGTPYEENPLRDNYNALSNFYSAFGMEKMSSIISKAMQIKGILELYSMEDLKSGIVLLSADEKAFYKELRDGGGDLNPKNVYYATNGRGIQLGGIIQTDSIDGVKYVYSELPLSSKDIKGWELKVVYEGELNKSTTSKEPKFIRDNKTITEKETTESTHISAEQAKELGPIKTKVANKYIEEHKDMTAEQAKDEIAKAMLGEGIHVDLQKFAFRELVDVLKDDNAKSLVKRFLGELGDKIGVDAQNTLERMRMGDEEYSEFVTSYVKRTHKADMALAEEHIKSDDKMIDLTLRANVGDKMLSPDEMLALMLKADAVLNAPETYEGEHANWLSTLDSVSSLATKMGQSISIIAKFYQETNRAKNLESTLIDKKQKKRIKDGTDGITEVLKKERTRSIKEVVSDIIKKPKEAVSDEQSLLDKIDKLTHKDNKTKTENDVVAVVPELVRWFKTELKSMIGQSVESDGYALLANVVTNRDKFKSVWDGARKLANDQYSIDDAEFEKMRSYIEKELVPSINRNRLDKILANAMSKDGANVSLSDIVAGYEQSGQRLKDYILAKTNLSGDDAIFLSNEIDARLREKIADRRAIIVKQLNQMQGDKGRIVKARKSLEDKLSEIVGLDLLNTDALRTIYAEKLNLPVFDDAMTMDVMETVKQINKLDRTVDYKKITELWSDLANRISSKVKITWGDRAMAYRKTMMLSNPATQMRNVASNFGMNLVRRFEEMFTRNVMGKVLGMQLASTHERYTKYHANVGTYVGELATGKRKLGDMFSTKIWGGTVSYNEGVDADTAKTVSSSWTTDGKPNILNNDKFKVLKAEWIFKTMRGQQKGYKKALALGEKAMDSLATTVRDSLKNGDLAFAESAYKNAMIGYMKKNGLSAPNADAISYANKAAEEATFRGVNMVSDWIAQGKHKGVVMKWMIDTVIPFAETPTNITKAVWERTGFSGAWELKSWLVQNYNIKHNPNWAQENPKKYKSDDYYAQKFTRSIVGTFGGFGGGIVLQLLGFLTGAKPQDEKERKRWEMNGIVPYALHIPETNIYVTLDWLQPAAAQLMVGASFSQAMQQDEGFIQAVLSGASGGIDSIMNMTLFTSLKRVLGGQWQDASASLFSIVESYANQFLPAYTNALAKTIDGTVRNTWSPEVGGDIATTFIMRSGLGGFWMMPKVDAWGNDVKQPQATGLGMLERGINSFLAPWKVSNLAVDNVTKEVTKIYGKAVDGDAKQPGSVLPQIDISNPKAFPYEGDYYTLTEEEYYKYMKYRGQYAHAMIQALMSDSEYNSLPDYADKGDSKFSWISDVYTEAATKAKEKLGKPKNINK